VAYDDVSVDYRPVPDADFITDVAEGCYPLEVKFTNYSADATSSYWDFGDGNSSGDPNPVHTFEQSGDYTVTLTTPGPDGKDGVAEKVIQVYDHPQAAFQVSPQLVYVPGDQVRFTNLSVGAVDYLWNFGDGLLSSAQNPMHNYQDEGIYDVKLHVTNQYGCSDSLLMEEAVTAKLAGFITFPNAFSPRPGGSNGTSAELSGETNTVFKPVYRDVDAYQLQVFNRWGQLIFQSNEVDLGWDGLYKGSMAPQAVYVWKVSGTFINGVAYRQTGSVLLVR
jgi:gliding motility-associated-like protein